MNKKILVCYLFTKFDKIKQLTDFINNYKKYSSGLNHELLICFKLIEKEKVFYLCEYLKDIKYVEFIDISKDNDFDFGSYKRVSEHYLNYDILFLNSHSYPNCNDWLIKLAKHKNDNNIIGTSGSFESMTDSIKLKKFYKFFSYFFKKLRFKRNFPSYPNPHLRTSSFFINGKSFNEFIKYKKINNKYDSWKIESGINNLTSFFKQKKFDIYVVNSDGNKFNEKDWHLSQTYNYLDQSKSIISDKHTRKYAELSKSDKLKVQYQTWQI